MPSLLVVIVVAAVVFVWVSGTRRNRQRWLERLDLPGVWRWQDRDGQLEFTGGLQAGRYRFAEPGADEQGAWELQGHTLVLTSESDDNTRRFDLRFFDSGKIGIDGPGRERRIYVKQQTNVVPLRR